MTGVSTLGQALSLIEGIKDQQSLFDSLSNQLTTGKKTRVFSGLRNDGVTSLRSRQVFDFLGSLNKSIDRSTTRLKITTTAISDFKSEADTLRDFLTNILQKTENQKGEIVYYDNPATTNVVEEIPVGYTSAELESDFANLQGISNSVYTVLIDALNIQDGDRYLLSGNQTQAKPVEDLGSLDTAITQLITDWKDGNISSTELFENLFSRTADADTPYAITDSIIGFSSELSSAGPVTIRTGESAEVQYSAIANDDSFRDALVVAAFFKNDALYPIADVYEPPNAPPNAPDIQGAPGVTLEDQRTTFFEIYNQLTGVINETVNDIDAIEFDIGIVEARINKVRAQNKSEQNLLLSTISGVEDVDINEVAVSLNTLQIQLDASFRVAARLQDLSLSNFI